NYEALGKWKKADKDWERTLPKQAFYEARASYYFCAGMVHPNRKRKQAFLRMAASFYEKFNTTDDRAYAERLYFYQLTNQPKKVARDLEIMRHLPADQRHFSDDLLQLFETTETLELFHRHGIDPCSFSEKLKGPWGGG
ncbi:MAG: hypothetical protein AAF798_18500, partial [Bacteroidota bacterium]